MQRMVYGGTCNISGRPYTVFRWRPGRDARYKKTIICQEVAKAKNVCQVCLLDLEYGLPVQVRDKLSGVEIEDIPHSDVNKEYMLELHKSTGQLGQQYKQMPKNEALMKLKRDAPNYKRNLSPVCTFFIRGQCNRGKECPFRHEMPADNDLTEQNIKDRYYGVNDPVAEKILERAEKFPKTTPPEDPSITTLYVGALPDDVTEEDLRDQFYAYGELASVRVVPAKKCGFVTYASRDDAERTMEALETRLAIKGMPCTLMWSKPQVPHRPASDPVPSVESTSETLYPSMDPSAMGSYLPKRPADRPASPQPSKKPRKDPSKKSLPIPKPPPGPPPTSKKTSV